MNTENNIRATALEFSDKRVTTMCKKIAESFERRDLFEASKGNNVSENASNGYCKTRKRYLAQGSNVAIARLFLALNVEPSNVIEHSNNDASMFSVYALDKIAEIAQFVCGKGASLQAVTKCFILCALKATRNGQSVITNEVNQRFLNSLDISSLNDAELIEYIENNRHKSMSTGAATQSSQMRNVLDRLGCGEVVKVVKPRDAVRVNADHALLTYIEERLTA